MERLGFEHIGTINNFRIPKWWECGWRRVSCNKTSCRLCGRILRDKQKHIERGEDPDDWKYVFEDVGNSLGEALSMIKKDAERIGIEITNVGGTGEPPEPGKFILYGKVNRWRESVLNIANLASAADELWLDSVAAADLLWYKNKLAAKTYRQLCNRWHLGRGDEYGEVDYKYTKYVLGECLRILKQSLAELSALNSGQKAELMLASGKLAELEKSILSI